MKKLLRTLFGKNKEKESFEQFQEHEGSYLYKTPDGDYMLFEKAGNDSRTEEDKQ